MPGVAVLFKRDSLGNLRVFADLDLPVRVRVASDLFHRVKPNHVSLGIGDKSDESVFTDRRFLFLKASTVLGSAGRLHRTVGTRKVNDGSSHAGVLPIHLDDCPRSARDVHPHREGP